MTSLSRRDLLVGGLGLSASVGRAARSGPATSRAIPLPRFGAPTGAAPTAGQRVVETFLTARPVTVDLAGRQVSTWAYGDTVPGPLLRATAGDFLRVTLDNRLPAETTIHWHGIRLGNEADGVPGMTQDPVAPGVRFVYEFTASDPGTYFFHPRVGVQLDRGLYAPMVIDDPNEPGDYDAEWVLVLDDWIDGTGTTPDEVLEQLIADEGMEDSRGRGGMGHGSMGGMSMGEWPWGDSGDVAYPHFLVNGGTPTDPEILTANPGQQRVRMRIINAASDTILTVALGGHRMTLTHSDGFAVQPVEVGASYIGMGERYDATVTPQDGVLPLLAEPFDRASGGQAMALVRTGTGTAPGADVTPRELDGPVLIGWQLPPADAARLPQKSPDKSARLVLQGSMQPYRWGTNGAHYGENEPLTVKAGQRLRLEAVNMSMITHPLHVYGRTFALPSGRRKDPVLVAPMQSFPIDLDADNTGDWMIHCHNNHHAEAGMMIAPEYAT